MEVAIEDALKQEQNQRIRSTMEEMTKPSGAAEEVYPKEVKFREQLKGGTEKLQAELEQLWSERIGAEQVLGERIREQKEVDVDEMWKGLLDERAAEAQNVAKADKLRRELQAAEEEGMQPSEQQAKWIELLALEDNARQNASNYAKMKGELLAQEKGAYADAIAKYEADLGKFEAVKPAPSDVGGRKEGVKREARG